MAKPRTIIQFPAGNFSFDDELIVPVSRIVLRGSGPLATTLDFTGQQTGAQGILATEDGFVIQDLRILNPKGAGVCVEGADGVIGNVAGIEIESSKNADVHLNSANHNTGGVLVFDNPGLPYYGCCAHSWNPAQTEALLALGGGSKDVAWTAIGGTPRTTRCQIPNTAQ